MKYVALLMLLVVLVGCRKEQPTEQKSHSQPVAVSQTSLSNDPVVVSIDGVQITRRDAIRNAAVMLTLNMNHLRKTKLGPWAFQYLSNYCANEARRSVDRAASVRYLADNNIAISSNAIKKAERHFEKHYGVRSKKLKRWHTIADLKYMLGRNAGRLDEEVRALAVFQTFTNHVIEKACLNVTDEDVKSRIDKIAEYNRRACATNALVFAQATNIWRRIMAKEITYDDAARKYSETADVDDGAEWGSFTKDQLSDEPALLELLPKLKVSDITPPVEADGGLAILRREENDKDDIYSFSRIFFRLPVFFDQETPEMVRVELKAEKERKLVEDTLRVFAAKLKIEYPDGTNVFSRGAATAKITARDLKNCLQSN